MARVITPWKGTGTRSDPRRPQLADDHALLKYRDATGQPAASLIPSPNLYTVEVICQDAVMTSILNDSSYQVLWVQSW